MAGRRAAFGGSRGKTLLAKKREGDHFDGFFDVNGPPHDFPTTVGDRHSSMLDAFGMIIGS